MYTYEGVELISSDLLGGSSRPWKVRAVREDGLVLDLAVKLVGDQQRNQYQPLQKELLGSVLAGCLGLRTPDFGLIHLGQDFISELGPHERTRIEQAAQGPKFASEWMDSTFLVDIGHLGNFRIPDFTRALVYAFDHLIWNGDRRKEKPNLLMDTNCLIVIDHEMCFPMI